ncbi:MAG: hypothetical protein PWR13_135 [Archaeoglobi archaeon]|nr:hypothetical protein [Archaeoglobi archaeon]
MKKVYTIGHSNRDEGSFLRLLEIHGIQRIVDIRRFPKSSISPHFSGKNLEVLLRERNIDYFWIPELGGYRKEGLKNSPNRAIKSEMFRNYADYMLSDEFQHEFERLKEIIEERTSALMCAEKFFWRCHRKFLSDFLVLKGYTVLHIIDEGKTVEHKISRLARVEGEKLIYDICTPGNRKF